MYEVNSANINNSDKIKLDTATNCTVIIADDHALVRHGIKLILTQASANTPLEKYPSFNKYKVVGETPDADETVEMVLELKPRLLILDLGLPSKSGLEVIVELKRAKVATKIVVLTMHTNELLAKQAFAAGASAYILKDFTPAELLDALDLVLDGLHVVPAKMQQLHEKILNSKNSAGPVIAGHLTNEALSNKSKLRSKIKLHKTELTHLEILSKREREVFYLLAEGLPNRTIAKKLFISPRTVETHRARVIKKLDFGSTADLIRYAIKNGLTAN